LKTEKGLLSSY